MNECTTDLIINWLEDRLTGVSYRDAILNYRRAIQAIISILGREMFHGQRMKPILPRFAYFLVKYLQLCTYILRNLQVCKYLNTTLSNFYLNNIKLRTFLEAMCHL